MKRLLPIFLFIFFSVLPVFASIEETIENDVAQNLEQKEQEIFEQEEKIIDDDTIYFDIDNFNQQKAENKVFKLKIHQNKELLKHSKETEGLNFQTKYTDTNIAKSKFINKTTISGKTVTNSKLFGNHFSFGCGSEVKEYLPLPDSTNYSMLSTSIFSQYKYKRLIIEGEFGQNGNILTETITNKVSIGPKINITKSTSIKGTVTRNIGDDTIFGELSLIYQPIKSKRNFHIEIDASSSNAQYNIPQQRLEFFGKFRI